MTEVKKMNTNLSSDEDIEQDGEAADVMSERLQKMTDTHTKLYSDNPKSRCLSGQVDSGLGASIELKYPSLEQTPEFLDKTPVQCSDAYESSDNDLQNRLSKLSVSDNTVDEGHYSMGYKSVESVSSEQSVPETTPIDIDLTERDEDGDTLTHVAIVNLNDEIAKVFIDLAEDAHCLNIQNFLLQTPLHLAVLTSQVDIVRALIEKGVDVTLRDQQGNTPLHIACRKGDRDSVSMIVQSFGSDVARRKKYFSIKNCEGLTCLHVAAQYKEFIILGHLFAKGADVNIGDAKSGRTMLHYAVERKDIETVSLLLTHPHIDVECKTFKGETPLVLAFWRNYQEIVKRLKAKGAYFSYDVFEESDDESST